MNDKRLIFDGKKLVEYLDRSIKIGRIIPEDIPKIEKLLKSIRKEISRDNS